MSAQTRGRTKNAKKTFFAAKCRGLPVWILRRPALPLLAVFLSPGAGAAAEGLPPCEPAGGSLGLVMSVDERLELTLEDGRVLRIAGLDPPRPTPADPELDRRTRDRLADWLTGREIRVREVEARPDRWGRVTVAAFASTGPSQAAMLAVGEAVLEAGLARFDPGSAVKACKTAMLAAEAAARAGALGLWADPYYAIIAASDHAAFAERAGTSVIVEGEVTGVESGPFRRTLLFGSRRGRDFSVAILQRNVKSFELAGLNIGSLQGQRIRVRGLLDLRFGPQVEISGPDEVEVIRTDRGRDETGPAARAR